jgi:hypothetical protein
MEKFSVLFLVLFIASCNTKRIDTSQMVNEMKKVEVKRITSNQISSFANEWGNEILADLNKNQTDINYLEYNYKVKITKLDLSNIDFSQMDLKEKQIIEASQYNSSNNIPIPPNLQAIAGGEFQIFTAPVLNEKNKIWRIQFSKKEIIQKASVKEIKKMTTK